MSVVLAVKIKLKNMNSGEETELGFNELSAFLAK